MKQYSQTCVEIDISNILHNIKTLKGLIGRKVKFMAVVKADAYGHGAVAVSKFISKLADHLAVATVGEALELKQSGIRLPILILSETPSHAVMEVARNEFTQTVYTLSFAKALSTAAKKIGKTVKVHIKIDTGMGRVGVRPENFSTLFKEITRLPNVKIEGIYTHLARAEEENGFTGKQLKLFRSALSGIDTRGLILHAANSAGALYHKGSRLDMVRIGLAMYGLYPPGGKRGVVKLKPALSFKTRVVYIKKVPAGTPLSYGSTYITRKAVNIATLPVGYADGIPRSLSNKGHVLIRGRRYPIVGRVCMDLTMVDVGSNNNVKTGDEAVLIGSQGRESISADEVAALANTISYEIICGIGKRVPRVYVN
jgi:alanine racemase